MSYLSPGGTRNCPQSRDPGILEGPRGGRGNRPTRHKRELVRMLVTARLPSSLVVQRVQCVVGAGLREWSLTDWAVFTQLQSPVRSQIRPAGS